MRSLVGFDSSLYVVLSVLVWQQCGSMALLMGEKRQAGFTQWLFTGRENKTKKY